MMDGSEESPCDRRTVESSGYLESVKWSHMALRFVRGSGPNRGNRAVDREASGAMKWVENVERQTKKGMSRLKPKSDFSLVNDQNMSESA